MSFANLHRGKSMNGGVSLTEMVDRKPILAALARQCGVSPRQTVCQSTPCPYDVTLREMIQAAMDRGKECPCSWVRKKSSFAAELDSMLECLMGKKAPLTSSLLNFLRGMLSAGILQVEQKVEKCASSPKENGRPDVIEIKDEDVASAAIPSKSETRKHPRKQQFPQPENTAPALSSRKRSRPDDVPCETPPVSPAEDDDVIEVSREGDLPFKEKKKRRKVRRAPWDKRKKKETAAPLTAGFKEKVSSRTDDDVIVVSSTSSVVEPAKRRRKEELPFIVHGGGKGGGSLHKRVVATDRVLRSKPPETSESPKVGKNGKEEFDGFRSDDAESATYYYVLFKNFLKSNLCDVKLRLFN